MSVEAPIASDINRSGDTVIVLPLRESEDGIGIYPEGAIVLVKSLRSQGVAASFAHPPERRLFQGKKGVIGDAVLTLVLGIMSNSAWAGMKAWLRDRKRTQRRMRVTFGQAETATGDGVKWWQVEGDGEHVIAAIDKLLASPPSQDSGHAASIADSDEPNNDEPTNDKVSE